MRQFDTCPKLRAFGGEVDLLADRSRRCVLEAWPQRIDELQNVVFHIDWGLAVVAEHPCDRGRESVRDAKFEGRLPQDPLVREIVEARLSMGLSA